MKIHDQIYGGGSHKAQRTGRSTSRNHFAKAEAAKAESEDKMILEKADRIIASLPVKLNNAVVDGKQFLFVMPVDGYDVIMPVPALVKKVMGGLSQFGVQFRIERRPDPSFPASHYLVARW